MKGTMFICLSMTALCAMNVNGQDFKEELRLANRYYNEAESLDLRMRYTMYRDMVDSSPLSESEGRYMMQGDYSWSELGGVTTIQKDTLQIAVIPEKKLVILSRATKGYKEVIQGMRLDTFLTNIGKVEYLGRDKKSHHYSFVFKKIAGNNMRKIDFWFSESDHHIDMIKVFYMDVEATHSPTIASGVYNPVAVIKYEKAVRNGSNVYGPSVTDVVKIGKGRAVLTDGYKGYKLINNLIR